MLVPTIHTIFSLVDKYYPHGDDANNGVELQHRPNKVGTCMLISMARNHGSLYTLFFFEGYSQSLDAIFPLIPRTSGIHRYLSVYFFTEVENNSRESHA